MAGSAGHGRPPEVRIDLQRHFGPTGERIARHCMTCRVGRPRSRASRCGTRAPDLELASVGERSFELRLGHAGAAFNVALASFGVELLLRPPGGARM